jgi:hypothetical protein
MKTKVALLIWVQTALVVLMIALVASRRVPLGIHGEWEWGRVHGIPPLVGLLFAGLAVFGYCGFIALGYRALGTGSRSRGSEASWLAGLLGASIAIQVVIPFGAAEEYDLARWAYVNYFIGSAGYYRVAREQAVDHPWRFLADYPVWIQRQDSLHIGTHPPGLIALQCLLLKTMEQNPKTAETLIATMPRPVAEGFRQIERITGAPLPQADRAALYLTSVLMMLACAGTVVPLYFLGRSALEAQGAWAAAAFWPLVPAANLFQPVADTAYPFLSAAALACAVWSADRQAAGKRGLTGSLLLALVAGLLLALGMFFTLAFLPVGLIVGLSVVFAGGVSRARKVGLILAAGAGFLAITAAGWASIGANPLPIWIWNLKNHARFYVEYPRTYLAWIVINPIELAVAVGLPLAIWCLVGLARPLSVPLSCRATICVLMLVNLTGRNLGEVARLWILFLPPLLTAAGAGVAHYSAGPAALGLSTGLVGLSTLALQVLIQVVYPI